MIPPASDAPIHSVQLVKVAEADVRGPEVWWMSHWDDWETLHFYIVVVRGGGRTLLINTGPGADLTELNKLWTGYSGDQRAALRERLDPLAALGAVGISADDVTDIILSPFQFYSAANVMLFPQARIHFSRAGWIDFHSQQASLADNTQDRSLAIPRDVLVHLVTDGWPNVHLLDDEDEVLPGVRTFTAGVHHAESLAVVIETRKGPVVWTDGLFKLGNYELAHPVGLTRSLHESELLQRRLAAIGGIVLPAFDDTLLQRHVDGKVA